MVAKSPVLVGNYERRHRMAGVYLRRKENKIHTTTTNRTVKNRNRGNGEEKNKLQSAGHRQPTQPALHQQCPALARKSAWTKDEEAVGVVGKLSENISTVFKNSRQKSLPFSKTKSSWPKTTCSSKMPLRDKLDYEMPDKEILNRRAWLCPLDDNPNPRRKRRAWHPATK
ncbi:MAG: hypothetical protein IPN76_14070 [Saprospiraceae bacterium]|nr:hypothetical protein [Saprospiraceae bacterium]